MALGLELPSIPAWSRSAAACWRCCRPRPGPSPRPRPPAPRSQLMGRPGGRGAAPGRCTCRSQSERVTEVTWPGLHQWGVTWGAGRGWARPRRSWRAGGRWGTGGRAASWGAARPGPGGGRSRSRGDDIAIENQLTVKSAPKIINEIHSNSSLSFSAPSDPPVPRRSRRWCWRCACPRCRPAPGRGAAWRGRGGRDSGPPSARAAGPAASPCTPRNSGLGMV